MSCLSILRIFSFFTLQKFSHFAFCFLFLFFICNQNIIIEQIIKQSDKQVVIRSIIKTNKSYKDKQKLFFFFLPFSLFLLSLFPISFPLSLSLSLSVKKII